MAKASDNEFPSVLVKEGSAPSNPTSGDQRVFIDSSDHKLKRVNSSGTVTTIESSGGSGITFSTLGTTSAGSSSATARGAYAKKITVPSQKLIASIAAFVQGDASHYTSFGAFLLDDNSGAPGKIIAGNGPTAGDAAAHLAVIGVVDATNRAITFPINYVTASSSTPYWIVFWMQNSTGSATTLKYNSGSGSDYTQLLNGDAIKDASVTAYSSTSNDYCIFANILV